MSDWTRRIRGAIGMGLTWAIAWAVGGVLIGVASNIFPGPLFDAFFRVFDAPLPALAIPGFIGGVLFSLVLGVAARDRRFDQLSLPRFAALGAVGGILLCLIPALLAGGGAIGLGAWTVITSAFVLFSTTSAAGSLLLARRAEARAALPDGNA